MYKCLGKKKNRLVWLCCLPRTLTIQLFLDENTVPSNTTTDILFTNFWPLSLDLIIRLNLHNWTVLEQIEQANTNTNGNLKLLDTEQTGLHCSTNKGICKKRHVFFQYGLNTCIADSWTCFQYVKTQGNILNWENHYISDHNWLVFRILYRFFVLTTSFPWIKQEQEGQESTLFTFKQSFYPGSSVNQKNRYVNGRHLLSFPSNRLWCLGRDST